jgi:hypothetical protein
MAGALMAFNNKEPGETALTGAMLLAEALDNLRLCASFVKAMGKG